MDAPADSGHAPLPYRLGGWRCIVADAPWHYEDQAGRMTLDYPTMTDEAIVRLPVAQCAADAAHLWFWTTDAHLPVALRAVTAWGFDLKRTFPWVKTLDDPAELAGQIVAAAEAGDTTRVRRLSERIGRVRIGGGHWLRGAHELCLFAVRGGLQAQVHDIPTVLMAPRTELHSQKPDAFMRLVERMSPGPRLELFARSARPGWDVWGNQAPRADASFEQLQDWYRQIGEPWKNVEDPLKELGRGEGSEPGHPDAPDTTQPGADSTP